MTGEEISTKCLGDLLPTKALSSCLPGTVEGQEEDTLEGQGRGGGTVLQALATPRDALVYLPAPSIMPLAHLLTSPLFAPMTPPALPPLSTRYLHYLVDHGYRDSAGRCHISSGRNGEGHLSQLPPSGRFVAGCERGDGLNERVPSSLAVRWRRHRRGSRQCRGGIHGLSRMTVRAPLRHAARAATTGGRWQPSTAPRGMPLNRRCITARP